MRQHPFEALVSVLVGVGVAAGLGWLSGRPTLAFATGLCWAVGLGLLFVVRRRFPEYTTGEAWADKRWTSLAVGVLTVAALLGVSPTLPITAELRLGLGLLLLGAGLTAYTAGTLAVLERTESGSAEAASTPEPTAGD